MGPGPTGTSRYVEVRVTVHSARAALRVCLGPFKVGTGYCTSATRPADQASNGELKLCVSARASSRNAPPIADILTSRSTSRISCRSSTRSRPRDSALRCCIIAQRDGVVGSMGAGGTFGASVGFPWQAWRVRCLAWTRRPCLLTAPRLPELLLLLG